MFQVEIYGRVRRAVRVEGRSQRAVAKEFGLSRETVRKMLQYAVPPGYQRQQPVKRPKLGPWIGYGIPCRQLPTADSMWTQQQVDVPTRISGTVLVSASTLTGYEFGSVLLSPFQPFMHERPLDTIDDGVFVYSGTFNTSLASAFGYYTRAADALANKQLDAALNAAEQAVAINPNLMQGQVVLGDTLAALHRDQESADAYDKALAIAQRMEPSAKADWTATLNTKLAALHV